MRSRSPEIVESYWITSTSGLSTHLRAVIEYLPIDDSAKLTLEAEEEREDEMPAPSAPFDF